MVLTQTVIKRTLLLVLLFAPAQYAQAPYDGKLEIAALGGVSRGIDRYRGMGGINLSVRVASWLRPYGEFSYFPGIERQSTTSGTISQVVRYEAPIYDFHGGVHLMVPRRETWFIPYAAVGAGPIHSDFKGQADLAFGGQTITVPIKDTNTDAAVNFGGGVRSYLKEAFGLRFEAKAYRPISGQYHNTFFKVTAGVFFIFP